MCGPIQVRQAANHVFIVLSTSVRALVNRTHPTASAVDSVEGATMTHDKAHAAGLELEVDRMQDMQVFTRCGQAGTP